MSIAAMKQALEALECSVMIGQRQEDASTALRAAIAEQEKVEHSLIDVWCECCGYMTYHREHMGCILKAHHAPVPAGWQLVPVEPTSEMMLAAEKQAWIDAGLLRPMQPLDSNTWHSTALNRYKAMLQAAPKPGDILPVDLNICPGCGGEADNGFDRCYPPNPYYCKKCMEETK